MGHPLEQGGLGGVGEAGHHLVVDADRLLGAFELAEQRPNVEQGASVSGIGEDLHRGEGVGESVLFVGSNPTSQTRSGCSRR